MKNQMLCVWMTLVATASAAPMSVREAELLLQTGMPASEVIEQVRSRKLIEPPTPQQLSAFSNASGALVEALSKTENHLTQAARNALAEAEARRARVARLKEADDEKEKRRQRLFNAPSLTISGKIMSVTKNGVLIATSGEPSETCFVKTQAGGLRDDQVVNFSVAEDGLYIYTTVLGAESRVRAFFDRGFLYTHGSFVLTDG